MNKILLTMFILALSSVSLAYGHGVTYGVSDNYSVAVRFGYAGGEPMSYAETKVYGPESSADVEYQNGRTDAAGLFAFVPNVAGKWRVVTRDSQGHKGSFEIVIEESDVGLKAGNQNKEGIEESMLFKILFGLSLIANLALAAVFIKQPKRA